MAIDAASSSLLNIMRLDRRIRLSAVTDIPIKIISPIAWRLTQAAGACVDLGGEEALGVRQHMCWSAALLRELQRARRT